MTSSASESLKSRTVDEKSFIQTGVLEDKTHEDVVVKDLKAGERPETTRYVFQNHSSYERQVLTPRNISWRACRYVSNTRDVDEILELFQNPTDRKPVEKCSLSFD